MRVQFVIHIILLLQGTLFSQNRNRFWRDTLCQNNLRLNYSPQPFSASVQTPPVYDFIGNTLVQVYSGIATTKNDTNLSFSMLVNGFGNLSLQTFSPLFIQRTKDKRVVYYGDFYSIMAGAVPNQTGEVEDILGTIGLGVNNSLLLTGDLNRLSFMLKYKIGASYGKYPGLAGIPSQKVLMYQCFQFRIKSTNGALIFDFPMKISDLNVKPYLSVGYYQKI